jgi:LysR family transcriptional regulator for metE and metH
MKRIPRDGAPLPPRPQLEVRDLELVLALARAGSTVAAAGVLHITQSAISRALNLAEDRLGARLFERTTRGLRPTAPGERLIGGAGRLLADLVELERQVKEPAPEPRRVRLVCECYTAYRWLPSALTRLRLRMPDLQLEIAADHTHDPVAALLKGEVDVALLTTGTLPRPGPYLERPLFADEVVFVMAPGHPLAAVPALTRRDLVAHPLITGRTPPAERRWFLNTVFGRTRPRLRFLEFPLTEAIVDAARAGLGVAVLSEWIASGYLGGPDLVVKRLRAAPLHRAWRLAYHRDAAAPAERLLSALIPEPPRLALAR